MNKKILLLLFFTQSLFLFSQNINPFRDGGTPSIAFSGFIGEKSPKPLGVKVSELSYPELIKECSFFSGDSLEGFNFNEKYLEFLRDNFVSLFEFKNVMYVAQRNYVKDKYKLYSNARFNDPSHKEAYSVLASACSNLDFENGNFTNWVISRGYNTNSNGNLTVPTAGTGVSGTDNDVYICHDVQLVSPAYATATDDPPLNAIGGVGLDPNGGSYSARVGGFSMNVANGYGFGCSTSHLSSTYSNGEILEQTFAVTAANALLSFDYSVLLNDGGHANGQQPYFHVYVKDATTGAVLSTCTQYYVQAPAGSAPPGFSYTGYINTFDNSKIYGKTWTSNSINLTPYIGQTVNIEFVAAGCTAGAHTSWAYVDVTCGPAVINVNTNPCTGKPVVLSAPAISGGAYTWSGPGVTGLTTQTVSATANGVYSVVVTPSQGASCSYTLTRTLSFATTPTVTASATSPSICSGNNSTINPSGATSYTLVNSGATGTSFNVNPTGNTTYSVIGTDATGCVSNPGVVTVSVITTPTVALVSSNSSICSGNPVTLSPSGASTYTLLNTGAAGTSFTVNPTSNTTYSVAGNTSACSSNTITSTVSVIAPVLTPAFTSTTYCQGNSTTLTVTGNSSSSQVSFANTGSYPIPDNSTTGVSSPITVSGLSGTVGTSLLSVNLNITHTFDADLDIFLVCPNGTTITLSDDNGSSGANYTNTTFSSSAVTSVTAGTAPFTGTFAPEQALSLLSTCNINGVWQLFVRDDAGSDTGTLTGWSLTFANQNNYSWAPNTNLSTTTGSNVVANPTTTTVYTVTATDATGCSIAKTITVTVNPVPSPTIASTNTLCLGSAFTFTGSGASTYTWSGSTGNGLATTTGTNVNATPTSTGNITYTLNVTGANSCTNTASKTVSVFPVPTANAGTGGTLTCTTNTLSLTGTGGGTYSWTGPAGGIVSGAASATPVVSVQGTYSLAVTNASGCASPISTVAISQSTTAPSVTTTPSGTLTCTSTTINITASTTPSAGLSYNWSGAGISGSTTNSIVSVTQPVTYNYTITNTSNGCKVTGTQAITQNTVVPTLTVSATQTLNCGVTSVTITGSATPSTCTPVWTGGVTSGAGSYSATAGSSNTYTLTVTDPTNGCSAFKTVQVVPDNQVPVLSSPVVSTITCATSTAQAIMTSTNPAVTYTWSGPSISSGTNTGTITVNSGGTYTLAALNTSNGCSVTATAFVPTNTTAPTPTATTAGILTCNTSSLSTTLNVAPAAGLNYTWTGPASGIVSGGNTSTPTVSLAGVYTVAVTNTVNGCSNTSTTTVTQNTVAPVTSASTTGTLTCNVSTVALTSTLTGMNYTWTAPAGGSIASANTQTTSASGGPGTYSLVVLNPVNTCTSMVTTVVTQNTIAPVTSASTTGTLTCSVSTVALTSTLTGMSYTWTAPSGGSVASANTQTTSASGAPGTYSLVILSPVNGCTNIATTSVTQNTLAPSPAAVASGSLTCTNTVVAISATPTTGVVYQWNGLGLTGSTTNAVAQGTFAGVYTVQVTSTTNSCSATATVNIPTNYSYPTATAVNNTTLTCNTTTAVITGGPLSGVTYTWTGPGILGSVNNSSVVINQPGSYDITITNTVNGCQNSAHVDVTQNLSTPAISVTAPSSITCSSPTIGLSSSPLTGVTYTWTGPGIVSGGSSATPSVNVSGTYTLGMTNTGNGCSTNTTIVVPINTTVITPTIAVPAVFNCTNTSQPVASSPSSGVTYTWSGTGITSGANTAIVTINQPNTYTLNITNTVNGCVGTETLLVTQDITVPSVSVAPTNSINCTNTITSIALTTNASPVSYTWTGAGIVSGNGTGTVSVTQGGVYGYTVTNTVNGCTVSGTPSVVKDITTPQALTVPSASLNCTTTTVNAIVTSTTSPVSYTWSGAGIVAGNGTNTITVNQGGTYNYTVTNTANNCVTSGTLGITQNTTNPTTTASTSGSVTCTNSVITLSSSLTGMSYTWTAPSTGTVLTGVNNYSATANGLGTYTLNVLNPVNSCTFQTSVAANQNYLAPTSIAMGANQTLICGVPTVTITGTANPSTSNYNWLNPSGTSISTNSSVAVGAAGVYTLEAINPITGCKISNTVQVTQSVGAPTTSVPALTNSITCTNSSVTMSVVVTSTDAVTYSWNGSGLTGPTSNSTAVASLPGVYQVTVTNTGNNCTSVQSVSVSLNNTPPTVNTSFAVSTETILTCAQTTLDLSSTPVGANYTYTWTGAGIVSNSNAAVTNVNAPGVYSVAVTNTINGCSATNTINVLQDIATPTVNVASNSFTSTCAVPVVTITGVAVTPSTSVTYSWTSPSGATLNDATIINPQVLSGTGTFTLVVTNTVNGCSNALGQATVDIYQDSNIPSVSLSTNTLQITCSNPTVTANATTTTSPVSYSWTPTSGIVAGTENTASPQFTATGSYSLVVMSSVSGCTTGINSNVITVTDNLITPTVNVSVSSNTGTITCTNTIVTVTPNISASSSNLTYSWTTISGTGIASPDNTANTSFTVEGIYSLEVTDNTSGCKNTIGASSTFQVFTNTTVPTVSITNTPSVSMTCANPNATLTAVSSNTNAVYTWTTPTSSTLSGSVQVVSTPGVYTISVTDVVNGCVNSLGAPQTTVEVIPDSNIPTAVLSSSAGVLTCNINSITVNASQANTNVTYAWTPTVGIQIGTENTSDPVFISTGNYSLSLTNTLTGCASSNGTYVVSITQNTTVPTMTLVSAGANTGTLTCLNTSVTITPTINPVTASYTVTSSAGSSVGTGPIVFTSPDTYTISVTDNTNGCVSTNTDVANVFTVSQNTIAPTMTLTSTGANTGTLTCSNGSVVITPTVNPLSTTFTVTSSSGSLVSSGSIIFTTPDTYTISVEDNTTGCVSTNTDVANVFTVSQNTVQPTGTITAVSSNSTIGCAGSSSTVTLGATTSANSTFVWVPGSISSTTLDVTTAGDYTIEITDAVNSCTNMATYNVTGNSIAPGVNVISSVGVPCGITTATLSGVSNSTNSVTYSWSGPGNITNGTTSSPVVDQPGDYTVTVTDPTNGCTSIDVVNVSLTVINASITADPVEGIAPLPVTFTCSSTGATSWAWSFGDGSTAITQNPSYTYNTGGTYTVVLVASSGTCTNTQTLTIVVEDGLTLEIPNVFTPNNDGVNDIFTIKSTGVKDISLEIFNRWGEKLYDFSGSKAAWDGKTSLGDLVPEGTYFYFVKATGFDKKVIEKHGSVNLFR